MKTLFITAGGTGGHVFPAYALALKLVTQEYDVHFVTDTRGYRWLNEKEHPFQIHTLATSHFSDGFVTKITSLFKLLRALFQAFSLLRKYHPSVIISFGGYATFPVLTASLLFKCTRLLHEQNAVIGMVNKIFAPFSQKLMLSYPLKRSFSKNEELVGMPVREKILTVRNQAYMPPLPDSPFHIFIMGGSQGSRLFSTELPKLLNKLAPDIKNRLRITQQCRAEDLQTAKELYEQYGISHELATFFEDVDQQLMRTHLVISRAGASTVTELAVAGRPSILVPYPFAKEDHQYHNALSLWEEDGAWIIRDSQLNTEKTYLLLENLIKNPSLLVSAAENARASAHCNALSHMQQTIVGYLKDEGELQHAH